MLLAAVHLDPAYTVPPALLLACIMVWYWRRIGRTAGHLSRRRIRRTSLAFQLAALPVLVLALSFVDPAARPALWAAAWSVALLLMLCVLITAIIDGLNNFRLGEVERREQVIHDRIEQAKLSRDAQPQGPADAERTR